MSIIVPQKRVWTRQPQQICRPSAEFADALSCAAIPGLDSVAKTTTTGTPSRIIVPDGVANTYTTSAYHDLNLSRQVNEYTLICVARAAHEYVQYDFLNDDDVTSRRGFQLRYNAYNFEFIPFDSSNTPTALSVNSGKINGSVQTVVIVARAKPNLQKLSVSACGTASSTTLTSIQSIGTSIRAGYNKGAGGGANTRGILGYAIIPRYISDALTSEIVANPWQVFARRDRYAFVPTTGGGTSSVYSDSALSYYIRSLLSSDSGITYAIRNAIYRDDAVGYYLRAAIAANSEVGYILRSAIAQDDAEAYKIRGLIQADDAEAYKVRGLVQTTDSETYSIRGLVQTDATTNYDIQSSTSVASTSTASYSVRGSVASDGSPQYSVRGALQSDVSAGYSVRASTYRDVVSSYAIDAAESVVYSDLTTSYSIDGVAPACPTADQIAAAVLAALKADPSTLTVSKFLGLK